MRYEAVTCSTGCNMDKLVPLCVPTGDPVAFEPALDYCVVKIPRWPYDKFPAGDRRLGTQMASTGEVMAIERTFEAALMKAVRSLEQQTPAAADLERAQLIDEPNDRRLFALLHALRNGAPPSELARRSGIDRWFIDRLATITRLEKSADVRELRRAGFSEAMITGLRGDTVEKAAPTYKLVDTCAAEFEAATPYYYSCWEEESESEHVAGVLVQFGGQTAINLAEPLEERGVQVMGSAVEAIDLAEDRRAFAAALDAIGIPQPVGGTTTSVEEAVLIAERAGYPVLVRPSYVLGGRAMEIVHDRRELQRYMAWAISAMPRGTVLVDKYLQGDEVEVDAVTDGDVVVIPGVMKHVERAGVHSGDSYAVYPAPGLDKSELEDIVDYTVRIARHLRLRGLVNVQYVVHRGKVHVLEVNPRASRTVPFLSKVTGVPMVQMATRVMLGEKLSALGWSTGLVPPRDLVAVKAPVFSMNKLPAVDSYLGPEMKSTGEAIGIDRTLAAAMRKAFAASGVHVRPGGAALLTIADADKPEIFPIVSRLVQMGCTLVATEGTARALQAAGFSP